MHERIKKYNKNTNARAQSPTLSALAVKLRLLTVAHIDTPVRLKRLFTLYPYHIKRVSGIQIYEPCITIEQHNKGFVQA